MRMDFMPLMARVLQEVFGELDREKAEREGWITPEADVGPQQRTTLMPPGSKDDEFPGAVW